MSVIEPFRRTGQDDIPPIGCFDERPEFTDSNLKSVNHRCRQQEDGLFLPPASGRRGEKVVIRASVKKLPCHALSRQVGLATLFMQKSAPGRPKVITGNLLICKKVITRNRFRREMSDQKFLHPLPEIFTIVLPFMVPVQPSHAVNSSVNQHHGRDDEAIFATKPGRTDHVCGVLVKSTKVLFGRFVFFGHALQLSRRWLEVNFCSGG